MDAPKPLIGTTEDGQLFVDRNTAEVLSQLTGEIAVISIVGKYRTGKSYLMNRLLGTNQGFPVGPTVAAATRGIWVWARPHPIYQNKHILLLDIEGLYDPKKTDTTHDMKLFSLAVLLSTCLVYNLVGALDSAFLQEFHIIRGLTDFIRVDAKKEETGIEYSQHFPKLFFVLRDFFLELNVGGKALTPDEYMEDVLKLKPGRGKAVNDYNEPRECIRDFFPKRRCFVIPRPVMKNPESLAHMDQLKDDEIDEAFLQKVQSTANVILTAAEEFKVLGHAMNAERFVTLLKVYVNGMNKGSVPPIVTAIENVKARQSKIAINNSVQLYKQVMTSSLEGCFPVEQVELVNRHKQSYDMAVEQYKEQAMVDVKSAQTLQEVVEMAYQKFHKENEHISRAKCKQLIDSLFAFLVNISGFKGPGGYVKYTACMNRAKEDYKNAKHKGPLADEMLKEFLKEKEPDLDLIISLDKSLSDEQRQEHQQKITRKRRLEQVDSEEQYKNKLRTDLMRQQEENIKLLDKMRKDFEERQDYLMKKYQEDIHSKETEHRRLQEENMAKQSEKMEVLLERMHEEFKAKDNIIQKQQTQIETFKHKTEELMDRLETNSLSKEELLAQMVPQKVETRTTCTSPTNASEPNLAKKRNMQEKKVEGSSQSSTSFEFSEPISKVRRIEEQSASAIADQESNTSAEFQPIDPTLQSPTKKPVKESETSVESRPIDSPLESVHTSIGSETDQSKKTDSAMGSTTVNTDSVTSQSEAASTSVTAHIHRESAAVSSQQFPQDLSKETSDDIVAAKSLTKQDNEYRTVLNETETAALTDSDSDEQMKLYVDAESEEQMKINVDTDSEEKMKINVDTDSDSSAIKVRAANATHITSGRNGSEVEDGDMNEYDEEEIDSNKRGCNIS